MISRWEKRVLRLWVGVAFSVPLTVTLAVGCSSEQPGGRKLKVVATASPITGIVGNVGGDPFMQEAVVPEGSLPTFLSRGFRWPECSLRRIDHRQ